jgi:hypothetical protein
MWRAVVAIGADLRSVACNVGSGSRLRTRPRPGNTSHQRGGPREQSESRSRARTAGDGDPSRRLSMLRDLYSGDTQEPTTTVTPRRSRSTLRPSPTYQSFLSWVYAHGITNDRAAVRGRRPACVRASRVLRGRVSSERPPPGVSLQVVSEPRRHEEAELQQRRAIERPTLRSDG